MSRQQFVPKTHAFAMPRHMRYLFLIDNLETSTLIIELIMDNYKLWGGRFNPFVPVYQNKIPEAYKPIVRHCDPDFIYYSPGVDIDSVRKELSFCHPKTFVALREDGRNNFPGVFAAYMLAEANYSVFSSFRNRSFMHTSHDSDAAVPAFYKLSFGFQPRYVDQHLAFAGYKSLEINKGNLGDINRVMCEELPSLTSVISELKCDPRLFNPENDWDANKFEFIIYKPDNAFEDLLYFWNRRLFQYKGQIKPNQIIATFEEVQDLLKDDHFEVSLTTMISDKIYVTSRSYEIEELEKLVVAIKKRFSRLSVSARLKSEFPYAVVRVVETDYQAKNTTKQVLTDVKDYLRFPSPFSGNYLPTDCSYMVDISLVSQKDHLENELKFPIKTSTHFITTIPSRIDKNNRLSLIIKNHEPGADFYIPTGSELIGMRLSYLDQNEKLDRILISEPHPSSAGLKLTSFVNLFNGNWHEIDYYLSDPFWYNLIKRVTLFSKELSISLLPTRVEETIVDSTQIAVKQVDAATPVKNKNQYEKLRKSNIADLNGVFCNKDLSNEITRYYFDSRETLREKLLALKIDGNDPQILRDFIYRSVKEDMARPINTSLQYFVGAGILFLGMRVKCRHCGSHEWYALKMLDNRMECKGCLNRISPSVTSELYYKFNDVIVNSVKSFSKPNGEEYEGNYVVLRILAHIHESHSSQIRSFVYGPCLDIKIEHKGRSVETDIDLVFIQNGKLVIGEAKVLTSDFTKKTIESVIRIANLIKPDQVMLAYQKGADIESKVELVKQALEDPDCEVVGLKIPRSFHKTGRLFGIGET